MTDDCYRQDQDNLPRSKSGYAANTNRNDQIRLMQEMTRFKQHKKRKALQNKKLVFNTHKLRIKDNFNKPSMYDYISYDYIVNMFVQSELLLADLSRSEILNLK